MRLTRSRTATPRAIRAAMVPDRDRMAMPDPKAGITRIATPDRRPARLALAAAIHLCSFDARAETAAEPAVVTSPAAVGVSCEREIAAAARRYDIPLAVFYAVGLTETGARGRLQPFSMNVDGKGVANASLADAIARFHAAKASGARMIDIGCMQINHHYHSARFASLEAMFDPAQNIDYAARFLRELKQRERTWTMAVARYNAGPNNDPAQKKYVCGVLARMVASGFGAWTAPARTFCFGGTVTKESRL